MEFRLQRHSLLGRGCGPLEAHWRFALVGAIKGDGFTQRGVGRPDFPTREGEGGPSLAFVGVNSRR
jgi:hypothetical protein